MIKTILYSYILIESFASPNSFSEHLIKCPPGYYINISRTSTCTICNGGFYGSFGATCDKQLNCYGDISETCTGPCEEGYQCPPGSTSPRQQPCGSAEFYCPTGSERRIKVQDGFYSTPTTEPYEIVNISHVVNRHITIEKRISEMHRYGEKICEPGFFCEKGLKFPCSAFGSYGISQGLKTRKCNGHCPVGYFCTPNTQRPIKCPGGTFGNRTGETRSTCEGLCSPGFYCEEGSTRPDENKCPGGLAGIDPGLTNKNCSKVCDAHGVNCIPHICEPGYYCPPGSVSTRQNECGGAHLYCPKGSEIPTTVSTGYYTVGRHHWSSNHQMKEDVNLRYEQVLCEKGTYCRNGMRFLCPAGRYSNETGSTSCMKNYCEEGFFCPQESTSPRQKPCGSPNLYCPIGSSEPITVPAGYYSIGGTYTTRTDRALCEPGFYCIGDGIKRQCPAGTYGASYGLSSAKCDGNAMAGYFTPKGSTSSTAFPCPPGRYGEEGMEDELCMGLAEEGYYTNQGSSNPREYECGGDMVYCPEGSSRPNQVSVGNFPVGGTVVTRSSQRPCESYIHGQSGWPFLPPNRPIYAQNFWCPFTTRMNTSDLFFRSDQNCYRSI